MATTIAQLVVRLVVVSWLFFVLQLTLNCRAALTGVQIATEAELNEQGCCQGPLPLFACGPTGTN
jgi:hypothetical protein